MVNAGMAAGGGGMELGGVEFGGVVAGGVVVVVVGGTLVRGTAVVGGAGAVVAVEGVAAYAAAGSEADATRAATSASFPGERANIAIPLGIAGGNLQESPPLPHVRVR